LLFVGFPYFLVKVSLNYKNKAAGIIEQQNSIVQIQTGDIDASKSVKILSQEEADILRRINESISGIWISEFDGRYKIAVSQNNTFEEFYDNKKEGFGTWRAFSASKGSVNLSEKPNRIVENKDQELVDTQISSDPAFTAYSSQNSSQNKTTEPEYFFQKQQFEAEHKGEVYIYQIQQLDSEKFILVFGGGAGKPLIFVKATSTDPVVSTSY
jgi:hypothetical protein